MEKLRTEAGVEALFEQSLDVLTVGLDGFADDLSEQNVQVTQLDWKPPADGDSELADILSKLGS